MSRQRYLNTKFWDDGYVIDLDPIEKLLFIYLLTNPLTNIFGIYEISLKRIAFDTGIDKDMVLKITIRFEDDNKIKYSKGWIAIKNFIKHQKLNPNIITGISEGLNTSPEKLIEWVFGKPYKAFKNLYEALNYINVNINNNVNASQSRAKRPSLKKKESKSPDFIKNNKKPTKQKAAEIKKMIEQSPIGSK